MEDNNKKTLNKYDYYAFISYSTADEQWAKWLHKHLENYNLPSALRRTNNSLPKYIRPVFWYKTDLSGTELHSALERELTSSRHLVLICSPESAKSEWVNDEVKSFVESNRTDSIIPFIVSGQPDNPLEEDYCYPPILRDMPRTQMLRGIDVSKVGKQHALIDVVSTMFGLRFDTLWQRHKRARFRRNIGLALLALLFVLTGIGIWDYNRSTYEYYADYVDVYGIPQGVCKLTEEQKKHRQESLRFEYRRIPFGEPNAYSWRLYSVANVNSLDRLREYESTIADRYTLQKYFYNRATGKLSSVENYNHYKMLQCRYQYSKRDGVDACIVDIEGGSQDRSLGFSTFSTTSRSAEEGKSSNITRYIFLRDSLGRIIRKTFHSNNDYILDRSITADYDGVYGQSYKLDSIGRIIEIQLLNKEMNPFQTSGGFSRITFTYDKFSNHKSCAYYNIDNFLAQSPNGWAMYKSVSDIFGNYVEERDYGMDLKLWKFEGAEIRKWKYDQRGFKIATSFYDDKGKPCMNDYQFSIMKSKYNKYGQEIESRYYDSHGKPVMAHDEYSICRMSYDEDGNQTGFAFFDADGKPCFVKEGYSSAKYSYNESHFPIEETYYGIDGKPCLRKEGYSKVINIYNGQDQLVEEKYYGTDGKPCLIEGGLSIVRYAYDERGNVCEESCYGTKGEPLICENNYHKRRIVYNDRGKILEQSFYGIHDMPCIIGSGYAYRCYTYDNKGNQASIEYYDSNRKPCLSDEGMHKLQFVYDNNGNIIKETSYDKNGNIAADKSGYPICSWEYDENGNAIKYCCLDDKENLFFDKKRGYAMIKREYNLNGLKTKESYYNEKGKLCLIDDDYAIEERKYDSKYNIIEVRYYDEKGFLYAKDGISIIKFKYNERSKITEKTFCDNKGNLMPDEAGVSISRYTYDEKGREISFTGYGPDRKPILNKYKYCKRTLTYDNRGNETIRKFYDTNGQLCAREEGYAAIIYKYDSRNYLIEKKYFGINMRPVNITDGYSRIEYSYSDNYNTCISRYYNTKGELVNEKKDNIQ